MKQTNGIGFFEPSCGREGYGENNLNRHYLRGKRFLKADRIGFGYGNECKNESTFGKFSLEWEYYFYGMRKRLYVFYFKRSNTCVQTLK